jgi:hypothetical protein
MAKQGLWANINRRKKLGISRPKSKSTISKEAYANMKAGFPKRKKLRDGGDVTGEKYYKLERERQNKFKKSEKHLDRKYRDIIEKEREFDYINSIRPEDSTVEPMYFKKGGMISAGATLDKRKRVLTKSRTMLAKGGIAKGCGKIMSNRRKFTKVY